MLPAPPSSCAGWWFSQLWRVVLATQPASHKTWALAYPEPGAIRARLSAGEPRIEAIAGSYQDGAERRCTVAWEWPGEDGMLHSMHALWQPGEVIARPLEWSRLRRPLSLVAVGLEPTPWPLRVRIYARGWHNQLLDRAEIEATDGGTAVAVRWPPPPGEPRLPETELPCVLTSLDRQQRDGAAALTMAGLTLPWRIDLDHEAWAVWRRFGADALLERLGGSDGLCSRHGRNCPWPATGRTG